MKNRFPFRLGTTSYILHDDILPNVHFLKDKVDHIELLVFESDETSNYPAPSLIQELNKIAEDNDLTYTVHLPINIKLGTLNETKRKKNEKLKKEILNLKTMIQGIDDDKERLRKIQELNFKLTRLDILLKRPPYLEDYEDRFMEKLIG